MLRMLERLLAEVWLAGAQVTSTWVKPKPNRVQVDAALEDASWLLRCRTM